MSKSADFALSETLIALLVPIGKVMIRGGLDINDLISAAKKAYVRAAIASVLPRGARPNVSRLSVITGLTRKEVAAIVAELTGKQTKRRPEEARERRAYRVLRGWMTDTRFTTEKGTPARLPVRGNGRSFSALVRIYGGDVTPISVLKELERMGVVSSRRRGELRLHSSKIQGKSTQHMAELARLFSDFAETLSRETSAGGTPIFFGFKDSIVHSPEKAARFQRTFSSRASVLLQGVDQWLAIQNAGDIKIPVQGGKRRVGIGIYLVDGDQAGASRSK